MFQIIKNICKNCTQILINTAKRVPMRKQGLGYLAFAMVMFLLLLAGYIMAGVFQKLEIPIQTIAAVEYESNDGC